MQNYYTPKSKHLTLTERRMIECWLQEGLSNREIARRLAKAPQTIHNEVKRGQVRQQVRKGKFEVIYSADFAQKAYQNNRKRSVKQVSLTKGLKEKITHFIEQKYSPEMMVKSKGIPVPISTIYYWIHHEHLGLTKADMLYPRQEKAKKKHASPNFKPAGKSIEEGPESINKRENIGDFEIDTVIQTRAKNECLLTLTDRESRYQIIRLIPDKSAFSVNQAQMAKYDLQKESKIPYLECAGYKTLIRLRKRRFRCQNCRKIAVPETSLVKKNQSNTSYCQPQNCPKTD
ncbi:transposase IS1239 [Streptococcus infantarius subsp. infantarius]|nr:transposase IS1239 [Streptococcus infantarius subsp. infantarius]